MNASYRLNTVSYTHLLAEMGYTSLNDIIGHNNLLILLADDELGMTDDIVQ